MQAFLDGLKVLVEDPGALCIVSLTLSSAFAFDI
jgi:hypothetical protein